MDKEELIIDFNPEIPQLIVAKRDKENQVKIFIVNHFKGKEALEIYDILVGRK